MWNLLAGEDLFQRVYDKKGDYSAKYHLADMISLIGPIPRELVQRERAMREWRWAPEALNSQGKLCNNAVDFYGGPFIDDDGMCQYRSFIVSITYHVKGQFIGFKLVTFDRSLPNLVPECITAGQEMDDFLDFMRQILFWLPEERKSAAELRKHPWLTRWLTPPNQSRG